MFAKRTDLALEARELWQESAGTATKLAGVKAVEKKVQGYSVTRIDILDRRGEAALGKPVGSYRTLDLSAFWQRSEGFFDRAVRAVGQQLRELIPESGSVLVAGLGNAAMTPDAVGPLAADLLEESGLPDIRPERLQSSPGSLMVTPRDIDQQVRDLGKVIGYGINWALQDLEIEEINALLS